MSRLPVIVAQGGIGPAGRTSGFHAARRLVIDALDGGTAASTLASLSRLTGIPAEEHQALLDATLIRKLDGTLFNADEVLRHKAMTTKRASEMLLPRRSLPSPLPAGWLVHDTDNKTVVRVIVPEEQSLLVPETFSLPVHAAGQLPTGFHPEKRYPARSHPRGLAMTVYGGVQCCAFSGY